MTILFGIDGSLILHSLTFQWLAIPFIQHELKLYTEMQNTTSRRSNKHKVLPHGVPQQMFQFPSTVGALDFKVWLLRYLCLSGALTYVRSLFLQMCLMQLKKSGHQLMTLFSNLFH